MTERHSIWQLADAIQMDLRSAQAKLVELRSQIASLNLPDETTLRCPIDTCRLPMKGPRTLAEHLHVNHEGPIPAHWQAVDALIDEEPDLAVNPARSGSLPLPQLDTSANPRTMHTNT